jgi:Ca-activated chloride channel family protein
VRIQYFEWDERRLASLRDTEGLRRLFNYLVLQQGGDVEAALDLLREMQARGYIGSEVDLDEFEAQLRDDELVNEVDGHLELTAAGERGLRRDSLDAIFGGLRTGAAGEHAVPREGAGREPLPETRQWEFGDDVQSIDFRQSIVNAARRGDADLRLSESDLEVHETEHVTSCATVLLLDISHSMVLYGEDRITPAKRVALALVELIGTKYPKDSLDLVLFGDDAEHVDLGELPYVGAGPYHTNTRAGLQMARRILMRRKHANKQVFMITDGKPSAIHEDGVLYRNSFGLDPRIVNRTLDEAVVLRRHRIPITTFMVARDPHLQNFVTRLTELNHGRAYFASPNHLEQYLLVDFIRNRKRTVR